MERPHIKVEMLSNPVYLAGVRDLVSVTAQRLGFGDADRAQIALAVDEALCNIIRHGYDKRSDCPIWLHLWPLAHNGLVHGVRIVIEDEARQIDPTTIRGRDLEDIKPGGLGVHIIREVMDEAVYEKREGGGMRLTLVKLKDGPKARAGLSGPVAGAEGSE